MGVPKRNQPSRVHVMSRRFASNVGTVVPQWLDSLGGALPKKQSERIRNGDFLAVVSESVDPSTYSDAASFRDDWLACELMSKFPSWELGIDRASVALNKLRDSEVACAESNVRLRRKTCSSLAEGYGRDAIIWMARGKIERLLGPFSWDHAEPLFAFGPGATFGLKSRLGDAYFKFQAKPEATRECAILAYTCISRVPAWYDHAVSLTARTRDDFEALDLASRVKELIRIVPGNRITTVPKNAKTDRVIAIEPTLNGFIQHGIGGLIRSRLKRVGVDLDDQTKNQELALLGSIDGSLATIDLAAASDSVSMELVRLLLPPDWVAAVELTRSPEGVLPDGTRIRYQKVSSMGNGYTFELESLIFWALVSSAISLSNSVDRRFAVYGDDLVIPTGVVPSVVDILAYVGFQTNAKKSFVSGPFRESCGKHYFRGNDVTPIYIREDVDSPARCIWLSNQIRRWARLSWGLDGRMRAAYETCVGFLPRKLRTPTIPDGYGDFALIGDFDEVRPLKCSRGFEGWFGLVHLPFVRSVVKGDTPYLLRQLSKGGPRQTIDEIILRQVTNPAARKRGLVVAMDDGVPLPSSTAKWRSVKIACAQWASYGPWLGPDDAPISVEYT